MQDSDEGVGSSEPSNQKGKGAKRENDPTDLCSNLQEEKPLFLGVLYPARNFLEKPLSSLRKWMLLIRKSRCCLADTVLFLSAPFPS